jgi:hypothetical protein
MREAKMTEVALTLRMVGAATVCMEMSRDFEVCI